jgi:hypothetical protein
VAFNDIIIEISVIQKGGFIMKWQEVRSLYPNRFVKFEIIESHIEADKEFVDEVAVIKGIDDGKEAMDEFINCKNNQFVYSTKHEQVVIELVKHLGIRRSL